MTPTSIKRTLSYLPKLRFILETMLEEFDSLQQLHSGVRSAPCTISMLLTMVGSIWKHYSTTDWPGHERRFGLEARALLSITWQKWRR